MEGELEEGESVLVNDVGKAGRDLGSSVAL